VSFGSYVQSLPFYTGQRVVMASGVGELDFGSRQGDQSAYFWKDNERLRQEWSGPGRILMLVRESNLEALTAGGSEPPLDPPPIRLASEGEIVLVANRPAVQRNQF